MTMNPKQAPSPNRVNTTRTVLWSVAALVIAGLVAFAMTPFGGWVQSFLFGTGVRWENAYTVLQQDKMPVVFHVVKVCRYDAAAGGWQHLPPPDPRPSNRLVPLSPEDASKGDRVAFELPQETELFWLQWGEQGEDNRSSRRIRFRDTLVTSGPVLCNDVALGPAPPDQVAACLPYADRAEARFVRSPREACGR